MACFVCPESGSVRVIERFGKFNRMAYAGCNFLNICAGESVAGGMSLRIQALDVRCEAKTRDDVFVAITVSVQYEVVPENLYDAFYKLSDSRGQITAYVFDVVRSTVPRIKLDDVFTTKEEIAQSVKEQLTKAMASFGFRIINALVTDIDPAAKVKAAMNEINAAQRLRLAAVERAEAEKVTVVKQAEAQAISTVKAAEAEAEAKYLAGQGIARQRQAIVNGLQESVKDFSGQVANVSSKDVMEMMLITQYFDTLSTLGEKSGNSAVFIPTGPSAVADVAGQIRQGFLEAGALQNMTR